MGKPELAELVQTSPPGPSLKVSICPGARVPPSSQYSLGPVRGLLGLLGQGTVLHCRVSLSPALVLVWLPPPQLALQEDQKDQGEGQAGASHGRLSLPSARVCVPPPQLTLQGDQGEGEGGGGGGGGGGEVGGGGGWV